MKALFIALVILSLSVNAELLVRSKVMMGTFATLTLKEQDKRHFKMAFQRLEEVENALSSYKKESPIYILNQNKSAKLYPDTYEALLLSKRYYDQSNGYFNIAIGSVTKDLFRFGEDESLPKLEALQKSDISLQSLTFTQHNAQIAKSIKIDLGGMGKGFGVDKVGHYLKSQGVKKATIALSGDIRCFGVCKVELQNPFAQTPLASFKTRKQESGISTSGNYNRYVKSTTNNHLINPKTKRSQNNFASITLLSGLPNSDLDAYATAASVMPKKRAFAFLDGLSLAYIVVDVEKNIFMSDNLDSFVEELLFYDGAKK